MAEPSSHVRRMAAEEMLEVLFPLTRYAFHTSPLTPYLRVFLNSIFSIFGGWGGCGYRTQPNFPLFIEMIL